MIIALQKAKGPEQLFFYQQPPAIVEEALPQPTLDELLASQDADTNGAKEKDGAPYVRTSKKSIRAKGVLEIGPGLVYVEPGLESPNAAIADVNTQLGTDFHDWGKKDIFALEGRMVYWLSDDLGLTVQASYSAGDIGQEQRVVNPLAGRFDVSITPEFNPVVRAEAGLIYMPLSFDIGEREVKLGIGGGIDHAWVKALLELDVDAIDSPPASQRRSVELSGHDWGYWGAAMARVPLGERSSLLVQAGYNWDKDIVTRGDGMELPVELDGPRYVATFLFTPRSGGQ